jgi:hypothetical protein
MKAIDSEYSIKKEGRLLICPEKSPRIKNRLSDTDINNVIKRKRSVILGIKRELYAI